MQTLFLLTLCLGVVYGGLVKRGVPKSSYTRTEEGQMVAIPGLETTTTIDKALGEVFGEGGDTTLAQDNNATYSTTVAAKSEAASSEATTTQKSTTTPIPTTEKPTVTTTTTTSSPTTQEKADVTSNPSSSTAAASESSNESTSKAPGGGIFGFSVQFPNVPTLPPFDKIKIPNPLGGLFSG